jgi:aspartate--ammonia ligase
VQRIYATLLETERATCAAYPALDAPFLPPHIHLIHSEDLERLYPHLPPRERETAICREHGAVFVIGIGAPLGDGRPHDDRAADYDDWITPTGGGHRGLNGDILVWYPLLQCAFELSSMGIRVSPATLETQLTLKGEQHKRDLPFHRRLLAGEFPLTIGGGIGQSRLCMLFLRKAHIGEVQSCVWPDAMRSACRTQGAILL